MKAGMTDAQRDRLAEKIERLEEKLQKLLKDFQGALEDAQALVVGVAYSKSGYDTKGRLRAPRRRRRRTSRKPSPSARRG
jgi:hypothetical protein